MVSRHLWAQETARQDSLFHMAHRKIRAQSFGGGPSQTSAPAYQAPSHPSSSPGKNFLVFQRPLLPLLRQGMIGGKERPLLVPSASLWNV